MNKQDLRFAYLNYFKKQFENNELIDSKVLFEIATDGKIANEVLEELKNEELITGINFIRGSKDSLELDLDEVVSLTEKGVSEINKMNFAQRLIEDTEKNMRNITSQKTNTTRHFSARRLAEEKKNKNTHDGTGVSSAKQLSELNAQKNRNNIPYNLSESFATEQIAEIYKNLEYVPNLGEALKEISKNREAFCSAQQAIQNSKNAIETVRSLKKNLANLAKNPSSVLYEKLTENPEDELETFTFEGILGQNCGDYIEIDNKNVDDRLPERIVNEKTGKHFIVKNGIKVLRGFAKASDLYNASEPDKKNYQRNEDSQHLQEIKTFLSEINPSGKYLPELTFVARGGYELIRPKWGNNLKNTTLGHFKNLDYYQLNLNGTKLYRIDGNHRLEALKKLSDENKEYYIPFSIILMGKQVLFDDTDAIESSIGLEYSGNYGLVDDKDEKKITDMEAFLFYFLNAKAKRLTTEENLKGLVNSTTWENHELLVANKHLPHLQYLEEQIKTNDFLSSYFCNNEPIKNIAEVLGKIEEDIELEQFKKILSLTNELLICDKWCDLKIFKFYCQLIFYIAYKNQDKKLCISILDNINNWTKRYKFDNTTFDNPIMLYESAEKTNITRPVKVFVAMPYYDDEIIEDFNDQLKKLSEELIQKYPLLENRFEIYEVMKHRGYEIDIQEQIIEQIKSASIFVADISEHICKKGTKTVDSHANPNVMYELGLAKGQSYTEIILLKNKKDKIEVPSDIITKYHNKFEFDKKISMRKKLFEAIENILKDKFEII